MNDYPFYSRKLIFGQADGGAFFIITAFTRKTTLATESAAQHAQEACRIRIDCLS